MFDPKAFLVFATFAAVLALAVGARQGAVDPWLALAGALAIVAIELLLTFGPLLAVSRGRSSHLRE